MIFLKALIFALVICLLGNFIRCLLWKRFAFTFFEMLPFLLAFVSLLTFLFIKILPFHPIWFAIPIITQILLMVFASALGGMRENGSMDGQRKEDRFVQNSLHSEEKSDDKMAMESDGEEQEKEYLINMRKFYYRQEQIRNFLSKKWKGLHLKHKNIENNIPSDLDIKADIRDNIGSITANSYAKTGSFHIYDENEKNVEILFLQADIFLVQGDIEKNKQLLFYISNKYQGTSIGNRAREELIKLYGKEIFLKER